MRSDFSRLCAKVPGLESDEHGTPHVDTSHYESLLGQVDFEQQTVPILLHCMIEQVVLLIIATDRLILLVCFDD